jgi:CCR4-NOT transcriptional complex subunit CAF120
MFEHSTLQEAYTGALIGGKGKALNNIALIMDRTRVKHEDWVRVRFGAGTPWRRCWCVITPPDEKEYQKLQKEFNKKKSAYDRSKPPVLKGDVKFYETKKTKKVNPIAQITNAYSAFAIYPQSKPLIDASTLVKLEGTITIFSSPPTATEGFVFVMPEVHPAVSGFEMMLRWLFPVWDTFNLYGRPTRLLADTVNPNSLMFAMPRERRYGYLEILDVSGLILTDGSQNWTEMEWRRNLKDLTAKRMNAIGNGDRSGSRIGSRRSARNSFAGGPSQSRVEFNDGSSIKSNPSQSWGQGPPADVPFGYRERTDSAPPGTSTFLPPSQPSTPKHLRSASESQGLDRYPNQSPGPYDGGYESAPTPPPHAIGYISPHQGSGLRYENDLVESPQRSSFGDEVEPGRSTPVHELQDLQETRTPEPVARPPAFAHAPGSIPAALPYHSPELRRNKSRMSTTTLGQMADASGMATDTVLAAAYNPESDRPRTSAGQGAHAAGNYRGERDQRGVLFNANPIGMNANPNDPNEGLVVGKTNRPSFERQAPPPAPNPQTGEPHTLYTAYQPPQHVQPYPNPAPQPPVHATEIVTSSISSGFRPHQNIPVSLSTSSNTSQPQSAPDQLSPAHSVPAYDRSQGHSQNSSVDSTRSQGVVRKPLPVRTREPSASRPPLQHTTSSGSIEHVIDQAGFDQVVPRDHIEATLAPTPRVQPQISSSSLYDDAVLSAPDFSNSQPSKDPRSTVEKPRAGVMRTVGGAETEQRETMDNQISSSIPKFDFGPTMNLAQKVLPERPAPGRPTPPRKASPVRVQNSSRPASRSSRNVITPEPGHIRSDSDGNTSPGGRTVPWRPGMAVVSANSPGGRAITPEEFVQQRAAAAVPLYAHQRQHSGNLMRSGTPTLPPGRGQTGEYSAPHSRSTSADLLPRPNSRGSNAALNLTGSSDYYPLPPAKEHQYVARPSGPQTANAAGGDGRGAAPGTGLINTIDARERERRDLRQDLNSQAVQNAMVQRQQAQVQAQQQAQRQSQQYAQQQMPARIAPQPQYQAITQYPPQTMNYPTAQQPQQQWQPSRQDSYVSPAAAVYAQGGGWSYNQQRPPPTQAPQQEQEYYQPQPQPQQGEAQGQGSGRGQGPPGYLGRPVVRYA